MGLFDTSSKAIKFATISDTVTGEITSAPYQQQKTKFGTNQPDFYDNGDPRMQILIPLKTSRGDDPADDRQRTLYVSSPLLKRAIAAAIRDTSADDLAVGGSLTVTFTGFDPQSKNPANPAKLYTASYAPPVIASSGSTSTTASALPATESGECQKVRELITLGLTDDQIISAVGVTPVELAGVRTSMQQA
jgi:hypothetical protein